MVCRIKFIITLFIIFGVSVGSAENKFDLILETGGIWQHRNDTEIAPGTGTRVEIDKFNEGPFLHYRIESYYRLNKKHALRLVYAPTKFDVTGRADTTTIFNGQSFSSTEDLTIEYQFNSYRFSYIYGFRGFGNDQLNIGFTGKVRDAETIFSQSGISSSYDNVGFVPLFYFEYQKAMGSNWHLNLTMDAAAAPQGRAIDAALKIRRKIGSISSLGFGIRSLEGGADNERVFSFSWFNYALVELKVGF